jgi:GTP-binding protein Era
MLDTPGIMDPKQSLHESMLDITRHSLKEADVVVALIPLSAGSEAYDRKFTDELFNKWIRPSGKPFIIALNKSDLQPADSLPALASELQDAYHPSSVIALSALKGKNVTALIDLMKPHLPVDHPLYPEDALTTEPERFFVAEIIREKIFLLYGKEIPYSAEVVVDEFKEQHESDPTKKDMIRCSIIVERNSQKRIIIGQKGLSLKKLGQSSRMDIETLLDRPVYLELFVKIRPDWRKNQNFLKSYGY